MVFNINNLCGETTTKDKEIYKLSEWLNTLTLYAEKCSVLIVGTHCESVKVKTLGLNEINEMLKPIL